MGDDTEEVAVVFGLIAELAAALGVRDIGSTEGCWEHALDERWWFAINGHKEPVKCSQGVTVPPFHCYLEYNGFPAGVFSSFGGQIAAGSAANEETFCETLRQAICRARERAT